MRCMLKVGLALALLASLDLYAEPFSITNVSQNGDTVSLSWGPGPERSILQHCQSLTTGQFEYVGAVLATNSATASNTLATGFYRIREVNPIVFPDLTFEAFVRDEIDARAFKYEPTNEVFDIDVKPITHINTGQRDIDHVTGIEWLSSLTNFYCSGNNLTNLDVSANTALAGLDCHDNDLTSLNVSANTALSYLDCHDNPLVEIIVGDTNNLPATFSYDGTPWIHEPIP
jgi:Leucine-rich repeat (LRR) protein